MNVTRIPADVLFRVFTACAGDTRTLILDVRPLKDFKKSHIIGSYSIRLAATGQTLLDYSKNTYEYSWSKDCWWDKHVVVYGEADLKRSHPVVTFLANDKHAKSVNVYPDGIEAFEQQYPFLVTQSTKANAGRRYPGEIIPKLLYLGDWAHAMDYESLGHLNISRIVTVHNNPENLKPPARFRHKQLILADVETEDVSKYFNETYTFIEEAKAGGEGVSRSAALCVAYLMRKLTWSASRAKAHCVQRRSIVQPNDGFWRSLCAFEAQLGIQERSDPQAVKGFSGADAPAPKVSEDAAGEKVVVTFLPMAKVREMEAAEEAAALASSARGNGHAVAGDSEREPSGSSRHDKIDREERKRERESRKDSRLDEQADREDHRHRGRGDRRDRSRRPSPSPEDRGRHRYRGTSYREDDSGRRQRHDREYTDRPSNRSPSGGGDRRRHVSSRQENEEGGDRRKRQKLDIDAKIREGESTVKQPAPVILESSKEGKAIGRLEMSLHSPHQRCVFGRLPSNEVVLEHLSISRQHAQLSLDGSGELLITDLGSAHQSNVNGVWIRPNQAKAIPVGSVFRLGGSTREFQVIMTPKERLKIETEKRRMAELKEAKRNTEYYNA